MEQVVGGILTNVLTSWGQSLHAFNAFLIGTFIAAPAIGTMMLIPVERRWAVVGRSFVASAAAAIGLTLLATVGIMLISRSLHEYVSLETNWEIDSYFPYVAVLLAVIAVALHYRERRTFSWSRAVGLLSATLTLVVALLIGFGLEKLGFL